jgi:hypothetical protein
MTAGAARHDRVGVALAGLTTGSAARLAGSVRWRTARAILPGPGTLCVAVA